MKIAHVADIHLTDRKGDSQATLDEQVELCRWIGEHAEEAGVDVLLVAGDIFDHSSTPDMRAAAITILRQWASDRPVAAVRGNCSHDRPGDISFLAEIRSEYEIRVYDHFAFVVQHGLLLASIPWPTKAGLAQAGSQQGVDSAAQRAMRSLLSGIKARWDEEPLWPRIILAHAELGSATMDTGQQVLAHADFPLHAQDLIDTGADYIALGHIHKHQVIDDRICYAGSIRQTAYGQDDTKGYCLVDVERGLPPAIQHIQAPSRRLVTYEGAFSGDDADGDLLVFEIGNNLHVGDAVRLKYTATQAQRERARYWAEDYRETLLAGGAHSAKIDATIVPSTRVRSEAIQMAKTLPEKLAAYWDSDECRPDRTEQILRKLRDLEMEVGP